MIASCEMTTIRRPARGPDSVLTGVVVDERPPRRGRVAVPLRSSAFHAASRTGQEPLQFRAFLIGC